MTTAFPSAARVLVSTLAAVAPGSGCAAPEPSEGTVARVIDGDTVELETGERIRYLMVDTPEITGGKNDCYGAEARDFNQEIVEGKAVTLTYDAERMDKYDRFLAYVEVGGREVNTLLVERGFACLLHIPPNGEHRIDEFSRLESEARSGMIGLWGACEEVTCD